jgi:hypothetical protein
VDDDYFRRLPNDINGTFRSVESNEFYDWTLKFETISDAAPTYPNLYRVFAHYSRVSGFISGIGFNPMKLCKLLTQEILFESCDTYGGWRCYMFNITLVPENLLSWAMHVWMVMFQIFNPLVPQLFIEMIRLLLYPFILCLAHKYDSKYLWMCRPL